MVDKKKFAKKRATAKPHPSLKSHAHFVGKMPSYTPQSLSPSNGPTYAAVIVDQRLMHVISMESTMATAYPTRIFIGRILISPSLKISNFFVFKIV